MVKACLDLEWRVLFAPDRVGESKVTPGAQQATTDTQGGPNADVVEGAFGLDEVETFRQVLRMGQIANLRLNSMR
jgi:hypothetical protein